MEQNMELTAIKGIIRRRKWWFILPFICTLVLVAAVALLLPDVFRSSATIIIRNAQIPQSLVQSTVTSLADQRIQSITQEVMSRSKILSLVEKYNLLPKKREKLTSEELVEKISGRIKVESIDAEIKKETQNKPVLLTIAFKLSYDDEDPKKAQLVANEISSFYMGKNLEDRTKYARSTSQFLEDQLQQVRARVEDLEGKIAVFRQAHLEELPEFTTLNMQKLEKMNADTSNINMQIRSLEEQQAAIRNRLSSVDPRSTDRVLSAGERLQQAQLERAALIARYSEKHPLVVAKNQEIALLEDKGQDVRKLAEIRDQLHNQELKLADLKARYSDKHPEVISKVQEIEGLKREIKLLQAKGSQPATGPAERATNPAYVTLQSDLEKIAVSIASLKQEKARYEAQIKEVYEKLHSMPNVSKEYNELNTEYQNARAQYNDLQQKLMAANVSRGMEEEQLGESFQVVEPAFFPEQPDKPNRLAIMLIGIVLGIGASIGLAALREFSDDSVHDVEGLAQAAAVPVLTVIPRIVTAGDIKREKRKKIAIATGTVSGIMVTLITFHIFIMDLYILYAKIIRFLDRKWPI